MQVFHRTPFACYSDLDCITKQQHYTVLPSVKAAHHLTSARHPSVIFKIQQVFIQNPPMYLAFHRNKSGNTEVSPPVFPAPSQFTNVLKLCLGYIRQLLRHWATILIPLNSLRQHLLFYEIGSIISTQISHHSSIREHIEILIVGHDNNKKKCYHDNQKIIKKKFISVNW